MENTPDFILITLAQAGDKAAFGLLIERYTPLVNRAVARLVDDPHLAHELTQESLLAAYLSLDRLRDPASFKGWLYGLTLNVCRNYLRQQKMATVSLDRLLAEGQEELFADPRPAPGSQPWVEEMTAQQSVAGAVARLSPDHRAVASLFYFEHFSLSEIASKLEISLAAVKSRLHKARLQLKPLLLPFYREIELENERIASMVELKLGDVLQQNNYNLVILLDEADSRVLPVWVGYWEGQGIAAQLKNQKTAQPMTFNLIDRLLQATGHNLNRVILESFKGSTIYGLLEIGSGPATERVEAQPQDALALASYTGCPVFATAEVMNAAAIPVTLENGRLPALDLDEIIRQMNHRKADPNLTSNQYAANFLGLDEPRNLDFSDGLRDWHLAGMTPENFENGLDPQTLWNEKPTAFIKSKISRTGGYATLLQTFNAAKYQGKRLRINGYVKFEGTRRAGLCLEARQGEPEIPYSWKIVVHDERTTTATADWQPLEVVLDIPAGSNFIDFGGVLHGKGQVWLAGLRLEAVGSEVSVTNNSQAALAPRNLDFRQNLVGWNEPGSNRQDYSFEVVRNLPDDHENILYLKSLTPQPKGFCQLIQFFKADNYRNRRVRLSCQVQLREVVRAAGVSLQVSGEDNAVLEMDGFNRQPMSGTIDWQPYQVTVDVPDQAEMIIFICMLQGGGEFWVKDLHFEALEAPALAGKAEKISVPNSPEAQKEWLLFGSHPANYDYKLDSQETYHSPQSWLLEGKPAELLGFGELKRLEPSARFAGKKVKLSAYIKTNGIEQWAGLSLTAPNGVNRQTAANTARLPISGDTGWHYYELELEVPENSLGLAYGLTLVGPGRVWFDRLELSF